MCTVHRTWPGGGGHGTAAPSPVPQTALMKAHVVGIGDPVHQMLFYTVTVMSAAGCDVLPFLESVETAELNLQLNFNLWLHIGI